MLNGHGIVQHHQHLPLGQQRAVLSSALVCLRRDLRAGHAESTQTGQRMSRFYWLPRGIEPAQVHIQLAVRETIRDLMCPVHRQAVSPTPAVPAIAEITNAPGVPVA